MRNCRFLAILCLSLVVIVVSASLLGGCAGAKITSASSSQASTTQKPVETTQSIKTKFSPAITVTSIASIPTVLKFPEGQSMEKNVWLDTFEQESGIKVKYLWTTDPSQYNTKLNLAITSNDLPDYFTVDSIILKQLVESQLITDFSKIYDTYASGDLKKLMTNSGYAMKQASFGGKLMSIPVPSPAMDQANMLWIRTDWLKKVGLSEPKTIDDMLAIAKAFTEKDPDGNGKNDTYGLAVAKELTSNFANIVGLFNGYNAFSNLWITDNSGKLVYGSIQPEAKKALTTLQNMYKNGQIDKEFGVKDRTKVQETIVSSKAGMLYATFSVPITTLQKLYELENKADWIPYPLPSADGKPVKVQIANDAAAFVVANKKMSNPEAVVMICNVFLDKHYKRTANDPLFLNQMHLAFPFQMWPPTKNLEGHLKIIGALKTKDTSKFNNEELTYYNFITSFNGGDPKGWCYMRIFGDLSGFSIVNIYNNNNLLLRNRFIGAPTKTMTSKMSTLTQLEAETFTKIIMGAAQIADFDVFVDNWLKLGGKEITDEVNEWYSQNK